MATIDLTIERFAELPLFQHVGEPIEEDRVKQVRNWKAAVKYRTSGPGDEIYNCIINRIHRYARTTHGEEWFSANWNRTIVDVKRQIQEKLEPLVSPLLRDVEHGDIVEAHFYLDVMEAWMIAEFTEPACKPWLDWHWKWYEAGHFPAGWQGRLPSQNHPDPDRLPELYDDGILYVY